jgi:hypothetical protein
MSHRRARILTEAVATILLASFAASAHSASAPREEQVAPEGAGDTADEASRPVAGKAGNVATDVQAGGIHDTAVPDGSAGQAPPSTIHYWGDALTVRVAGVPLESILQEIGRQSGATIRGQLVDTGPRSVAFENVPLPQALRRLLHEQNFLLLYDGEGQLSVLELLSSPAASSRPVAFAAPAASVQKAPPGASASLRPTVALLERPVGALPDQLAEALGTDQVTLRRLIETGVQHEDQTVRAEAMRVALDTLQSDPELQSALLGRFAADDGALGQLILEIGGERTHEALFNIATQARGDLSHQAAALMQLLPRPLAPTDG